MSPDHDLVLVVDYGAQYAQLIARRVREARVYSEIVPHTMPVAELLAKQPSAVILSGGPSSVYEPGAPQLDAALLEAGVPVFGICYGFMAMARALGGRVARTGQREYGRTRVEVIESGVLLDGLPPVLTSWMSHGDEVTAAPSGFRVNAQYAVRYLNVRAIPGATCLEDLFDAYNSGSHWDANIPGSYIEKAMGAYAIMLKK